MTTPRDNAKAVLREQVRSRIAALMLTEKNSASRALCDRLRMQPIWKQSGRVLFFAPLADEPDIWPLLTEALAAGKQVALPVFNQGTNQYSARRILDPEHDIVLGKFGIRETAETGEEISGNQLDLILVPGVAFDSGGRRLGRGRGFYDRLLTDTGGTKCGVAFDEQLVEAVPVDPHDILLNCILTPQRWIET